MLLIVKREMPREDILRKTKTVNAPYVPSRVVREGALMSALLPSARTDQGPFYQLIPAQRSKRVEKNIRGCVDTGLLTVVICDICDIIKDTDTSSRLVSKQPARCSFHL